MATIKPANILKSSINYLGSKYKYIPELSTFIKHFLKGLDLFAGSGVVALNFNLDYNDISTYPLQVYTEVTQERIDAIIERFKIEDSLIITPSTRENRDNKRVNPKVYAAMIKECLEKPDIALEFVIRNVTFNLNKNYPLTRLRAGNAGKYIRPKMENREKFLNRKFTHLSFRDIDFEEYDFIFVDPPYLGSDERCMYDGWSETDERDLLDKLAVYKGNFLLTNFYNDILKEYVEKYGWNVEKSCNFMSASRETNRDKVQLEQKEVIISNYKNRLF